MNHTSHTRHLGIAAAAIAGLGILWSFGGGEGEGETSEPDPPPPVSSQPLAATLIRASLDAEALAAAGLTTAEATAVVENVIDYLGGQTPTALNSADSDYVSAKVEVDSLRRKVRSGLASSEEVTDLATAKSELSTAEAARESALASLFTEGTADLSAGKVAILETIRDNREWRLPVQYLVVERTQQEWVNLGNALTNEKIAAKEEEAMHGGCASMLSTCNADSDVATAKVAVDTSHAAVQTAWNAALEP